MNSHTHSFYATHTLPYAQMNTHTCAYIHVHVHVHTHIHIHVHTHTHTHTHTHLHTCTQEIAQAYKDQNKFLSCEIVELNQLRSDDSDAIRSLNR